VRAALLLACGTAATPVLAQGTSQPPTSPAASTSAAAGSGRTAADKGALQEVTVTAQRLQLIGNTATASQGVVTGTEVNLAPAYRPGQVLETVPGLDVTTHSGEGKANQYLMRGYNLDHGTDLAVFVDGMPVNEPTHAHGQGYTDINFLIPQLVTGLTYTKGTYYANIGDFGSVGSLHINYVNTIPDQVSATLGTLDFQHYFAAGSTAVGNGNLLGALEYQHYDGPTTIPGDQQKYNGALRFSDGDADKGYSITALAYHDTWNSQTDVPYHALYDGQLSSRWDQLDKTDGGYAQRSSLSWQYHDHVGNGQFLANAYVISNHMTLWNDFTHFVTDQIDGDQEAQHEDRTTVGGDSSYGWTNQFGAFSNEWLVGLHVREDYSRVYRLPSESRILLTPGQIEAADYDPLQIEDDNVRLHSVAAYMQATTHWTDRFRSVLGFREDYMYGTDQGTWSGAASRALAQPKASLIYRVSPDTEIYGSWGIGFHSDDLRGVNQARTLGEYGAPLIASQTGEELGLRQDLLDHKIALTVALFSMNAQSETTYDPDAGQDGAGPASIRRGYEINLTYQVTRWLEIYGSYSGDHARYKTISDDGSGHEGRYLPNAPVGTGEFSVYVNNLGRWSGSLEYRFLGRFPVTSGPCTDEAAAADFGPGTTCANAPMYNNTNSTKSPVWGAGYGEWNGEVNYAFPHGWTLGLGVYNILNSHANTMEYYYIYQLQDAAGPEAGKTFHPLEPISARLTIGKIF
jgi:outer membrane receptor protein involved in Fe transport